MNNTGLATEAFSRQSSLFDQYNDVNVITAYCRNEIHSIANKFLRRNDRILELNCGTGIDALYFSTHHHVTATDGSAGMVDVLTQKENASKNNNIIPLLLNFENLYQLQPNQYDFIFSNFGGLNCTARLDQVLMQLPSLLMPEGRAMLVMMPPWCWWELLHALWFNFKLAFRRFRKNGAMSNVEGLTFITYYYHPSYIKKYLKGKMKVVYQQGLCNAVPPEYMHHHVKRWRGLFQLLKNTDSFLNRISPFKNTGDYFIIILEKA
jgi:ubiquinone/menaquinone biosynthesis C-methylase UbiE